MKTKHILGFLLILVLIATIFATQIFAKNNKRTCTDSDVTPEYPKGKDYYTKGNVTACFSMKPVCNENGCSGGGGCGAAVDICSSESDNTVIENYCAGINHKRIEYKCPDGYACDDGACIQSECASHELSIEDVFNDDGKIAVSYKTVGAGSNVKVILIIKSTYVPTNLSTNGGGGSDGSVEEPEPSPGGGGGGAGGISCPITFRGCGGGSGSNVASCTVHTNCSYPISKPDTRYYVKITDNECLAVYDSAEIQPIMSGCGDGICGSALTFSWEDSLTLPATIEYYGLTHYFSINYCPTPTTAQTSFGLITEGTFGGSLSGLNFYVVDVDRGFTVCKVTLRVGEDADLCPEDCS